MCSELGEENLRKYLRKSKKKKNENQLSHHSPEYSLFWLFFNQLPTLN